MDLIKNQFKEEIKSVKDDNFRREQNMRTEKAEQEAADAKREAAEAKRRANNQPTHVGPKGGGKKDEHVGPKGGGKKDEPKGGGKKKGDGKPDGGKGGGGVVA